jgi:hypothetical protein
MCFIGAGIFTNTINPQLYLFAKGGKIGGEAMGSLELE